MVFFSCSLFYRVKSCKAQATYLTPYGKRIEYTLLSPHIKEVNEQTRKLDVPCRLIIHFKDKFLIRNKKRWSQVSFLKTLIRRLTRIFICIIVS